VLGCIINKTQRTTSTCVVDHLRDIVAAITRYKNKGSIRYKNSKKLAEYNAAPFSATRNERVISVLSARMQVAARIILHSAVNEKNNNIAQIQCQSSGQKTSTLRV
jgi:hypothetical protein